jgi:hypothetical protein
VDIQHQQVQEVLGCGLMEQVILDNNYGEGEQLLLCCFVTVTRCVARCYSLCCAWVVSFGWMKVLACGVKEQVVMDKNVGEGK